MASKPRQLKTKEYKKAIALLDCTLILLEVPSLIFIPSFLLPLITILTAFLNQLKGILTAAESSKDSSNSDTPSSKRIGGPANPREKGKHPVGGKKGHKGETHLQEANPDETIDLTPEEYKNNPDWRETGVVKRQVIEIEIQKKVIEFTISTYENIHTGEKSPVEFPEGVNAPVQFGADVRALIVYLREHGNLSYERIAEFFNDVAEISICPATEKNIVEETENSEVMDQYEEAAEKDILESHVVNSDETGVSVGGTTHWIHLLVGKMFCLFAIAKNRSKAVMDSIGILPRYKGILVHDCWQAYFMFKNFLHSLCNAHIIRELNHAVEMGQSWASEMIELLLDLNEVVKCYGGMIPISLQIIVIKKYRQILDIGFMSTGGRELTRPPGKKRGRLKKPKYRNLLERLNRLETEILRFMTDIDVPFTNNDAERPVRMIKVHSKISGCFRSLEMARGFCRMRGYIVTSKKNGLSAYQAIKMLVKGETPDYITERLAKEPDETKLEKYKLAV